VRPNAIVLINPNNPNGGYIRIGEIQRILDATSDVGMVIIDESFIHFAREGSSDELVDNHGFCERHPNVVLLKSMSKDFGVAGLRAGYAVMAEERVDALLRNGYLWNSNGLAEYFFRLYARPEFMRDYDVVRRKYISETDAFVEELKKIKSLKIYPTSANFVLIELPPTVLSLDFSDLLLIRYGIYVRNCDDKIGLHGSFIRIASRRKSENAYIIECLAEICGRV
jgi:histidinol-phosphate/aromatic aminotransferase/cobyric acid decarboxylase-like protein